MRRILVPLDGSPLSESVLPYARTLAAQMRSELVLLSVWETLPEEIESVGAEHVRVLSDHGVRYFRSYLQNVADVLRREGLDVSTDVRAGHPAFEIMLATTEMDVNLVAMASHGRRGVTQRRRGSVADKVLRGSTVPVLIVGPRGLENLPSGPVALRSIFVPLDGSVESESAMAVAAEIARSSSCRMSLVRVVPPVLERFEMGPPGVYEAAEVTTRLVAEARRYLKGIGSRYSDLVENAIVERGIPAEVIMRTMERHQPDLVVMASRSRFAGDRWALGSVADEVIEGPVPVILVHPGSVS